MSNVLKNDEKSKLNADINNEAEEQKEHHQSRVTTSTHRHQEPYQAVSPGQQQNDSTSLGAVEQDHFPLKLHKLLEQLEKEGKNHIIGWNPDGKSFAVFRPKEFAADIMATHFRRQSRYKSFQRQLNLYAFKRECHGHIKGVYSHEMFIRNNRELCKGMKRERATGSKAVGAAAMRGTTSVRSSNHSEASSTPSPDYTSRKRPLQMTAQHERDMLLASQDMVALAMKQKLYNTTHAVRGSTETPEKMKADIYRSHSEPTLMMGTLDSNNNRNVSSVDQETSGTSLNPNFELRQGYGNTSTSSIVATYTQDDLNLTYNAQSSGPPLHKMAADIHPTTASSSDVAFRAPSDCNNMVQQNPLSNVEYFGPLTHLLPPNNNPMGRVEALRDHRNVSTSHVATGIGVASGNFLGIASSSQYRGTDEDDSGSIGTIDDFDNMIG